jgi:hypothetical protein
LATVFDRLISRTNGASFSARAYTSRNRFTLKRFWTEDADVRYGRYGHNLYSSQYSLLILKMDNEMDKMDNEMDKQNPQFI